MFVIPKFSVVTGRILSQIEIFVKMFGGVLVLRVRAVNKRCISEVDKFGNGTRSEKWMVDYHVLVSLNASLAAHPFLSRRLCGHG